MGGTFGSHRILAAIAGLAATAVGPWPAVPESGIDGLFVAAPRSNHFGGRALHKPRRFKRNHKAALARRRRRG